MTIAQPIQKCRCASKTHEHKPGKCTNLATEPESLCKSCYEKTSAELKARSRLVGRQRKGRVKTRAREGRILEREHHSGRCPRTGTKLSTGRETDAAIFERLPDIFRPALAWYS